MQELTERQSTIIRLIADGCTVKEIAFTLSLKVITVRKHIRRIVYKLGAKTTCHAAAIFAKQAAQERESKEIAARQAEDAARVASNKAIMRTELRGAWISEGGSAADFESAFDELYRAEMIRRALARSRGDTAKGRQAVKNAMR